MAPLIAIALALTWAALLGVVWLAIQLLRQNGRVLLRMEALEAELVALRTAFQKGGLKPFGDRSLAKSRLNRNGLMPGSLAPPFTLPRVDGGSLSLADYAGRRVLLVFSDPDCGPCDVLAPQLEALSKTESDVAVVMVSRGNPERNRKKVAQHGLTFPVVLQEGWQLSREYAKFATPIGYLIDEEGIIAAPVAMGAEAILALPASTPSPLAAAR